MNLQIAIIISLFGLCITMPLFVRYFAYLDVPLWIKSCGFIVCLMIAALPVFTARNWAPIYGPYFAAVEYGLYFIYIFAVILFACTFMRDVVWMGLHFLHLLPSPCNPTIFAKVNFITTIVALICTVWSLYDGTKIPDAKHVFLTNPKLTHEKTVVVLSDLHISRTTNPEKIQAIIDKTNALNPDVILLAGDTLDDDVDIIYETASQLKNLHAKEGVYFVSGNHEFYIGYHAAMQTLEKIGLTSLENKKIALTPDFYLAGVADIRSAQRFGNASKLNTVLSDIPPAAYTLFVSHSPTPLDLPFDLQVAGHTHGGQIFPFHFFSWFGNHQLLAGFYPSERIYVSRGAGQWGPQMRFLSPSEITVLHLTP